MVMNSVSNNVLRKRSRFHPYKLQRLVCVSIGGVLSEGFAERCRVRPLGKAHTKEIVIWGCFVANIPTAFERADKFH